MPPKPSRSIVGIQCLRAVAALSVLLHHTLEELFQYLPNNAVSEALTRAGAVGVDIFFVISGFIMYESTQRLDETHPLSSASDFLKRRAIRIIPLYWSLLLLTLALHSTGLLYKSKTITLADSIKSFFFIQNPHMLIGLGWTLNYEFYFYTIIAAGIALGLHRHRLGFTAIFLGVMIAIANQSLIPGGFSYLGNPIVMEFLFGMCIARFLKSSDGIPAPAFFPIAAAASALIAFFAFRENGNSTNGISYLPRFLVWGLPSALIVLAACSVKRAPQLISKLGDASYSLYLCHAFVMTALGTVIKARPPATPIQTALYAFSAITFAIAISWICHENFEKPISQHLSRR